jgi:hypothetical protein
MDLTVDVEGLLREICEAWSTVHRGSLDGAEGEC